MRNVFPFIILLGTYLALTPGVNWSHLTSGVVVAAAILSLLRPGPHVVRWRRLPSALGAAVVYLVVLIGNVVVSGLQVIRIVLHPRLPLRSGIIAFSPECDSEVGQALAAHAISLTPGELLIEMDADGTMYIHTLDVAASQRMVQGSQKRRRALLDKMFD